MLNFINAITDDYIKSYEYELNLEFENKENQNINDMIMSQSGKLKTLDKETKTLAIFSLEPQNESVYLNNVYLENI
ncbi:MAG: hypothetical protein LBQ59_01610 [Candidatus Peribacteria bacterium]|nr:hypothetical protein [Candidatus Peribacteria bacterium]